MSTVQYHQRFTILAISLATVAAGSWLSSVSATDLPIGHTTSIDSALFETALKVPAVTLAGGYRVVKNLLEFLPLAERGMTIQTPEQTIGPDNAKAVKAIMEKRLATYEVAIQRRGYQTISGKYQAKANASSSCGRIQSAWADAVSQGMVTDITINQDGFALKLVHRLQNENKFLTSEIPGTIVESTFVFEDPMNSDFQFVGEITPEKIVIRPAIDRILAAWPKQIFQPPSRDDLSNCTVTLAVAN